MNFWPEQKLWEQCISTALSDQVSRSGANNRFFLPIKFKQNSGKWTRTNKISTNHEIKGLAKTDPAAPLRVCWGRYDDSGKEGGEIRDRF